jgi:hypothetical protein
VRAPLGLADEADGIVSIHLSKGEKEEKKVGEVFLSGMKYF